MNILLKLFSREALWRELLRRESFNDISGEIEAVVVWRSVFNRTPELSDFLKKREISLLKFIAMNEKPNLFILGQIAENRLWQRFDMPGNKEPEKAVEKKIHKLKPLEEFVKKIQKHDDKK